jgi:tetratricopeptide (TPR) repeat protein
MNILLAKKKIVYYAYDHIKQKGPLLTVTALLIISISLTTFHSETFGEVTDSRAIEYRIQGYEEQLKGRYDKALSYYAKAAMITDNNAVVHNDMGVIYEKLKLLDKAEESYLKAVERDPNYLPPYTNLAYFYQSRGDNARAVIYFQERLLRSSVDDPWRPKIIEALKKIDPHYEPPVVADDSAARESRQKVVQAQEDLYLQVTRAEKHYQRGQGLFEQQKYAEAIEEFDRALAMTPDNPKVLKARMKVQYERDVAEVKKLTEKAIQKLNLGEIESAKEEFHRILATFPGEAYH